MFSANLPSLVIGTVGGGTRLATQSDCLELLGCLGAGKVLRFAEIIAASCLALDISTSAAIASNEFVKAHNRLGRNRPALSVSPAEIDNKFIERMLLRPNQRVATFSKEKIDQHAGLTSSMVQGQSSRFYGLYRCALHLTEDGKQTQESAVLKVKAEDNDVIDLGVKLSKLSGEDALPGLFELHSEVFGFERCHLREIAFYRHAKPEVLQYCPRVLGLSVDDVKHVYSILLEDLSGCSHFDTVNHPEQWDDRSIRAVLDAMASIHAAYWKNTDNLARTMDMSAVNALLTPGACQMLRQLTTYNRSRYPELVEPSLLFRFDELLDDYDAVLGKMTSFGLTLVHNDFNPRNLCLRNVGGTVKPVLYDWELAGLGNPQRDLIEFLVYVLPSCATRVDYDFYTAYYVQALEARLGHRIAGPAFDELMHDNAVLLALVRFNLYLLANNLARMDFLPRVYQNLSRYIQSTAVPRAYLH